MPTDTYMTPLQLKHSYSVAELRPYINWVYFHHTWGLTGKPEESRFRLRAEADAMLDEMQRRQYHAHSLLRLCIANSQGDDLLLNGETFPLLRQQTPDASGHCLCLSDFVKPSVYGPDTVGVFATTVDSTAVSDYESDSYQKLMAQTLADRLAEAAAELLHLNTRRRYWGYAPDEQLTVAQLHQEQFQGIRPAVGYPSLPDTSLNFVIDRLLHLHTIGIRLTESGAMQPHASVTGLMLAHPSARYFTVAPIGDDQLHDYARRRGIPLTLMRKFLAPLASPSVKSQSQTD